MHMGMHTDARQLSTRGTWTLSSQPGGRHIPTRPAPRGHEAPGGKAGTGAQIGGGSRGHGCGRGKGLGWDTVEAACLSIIEPVLVGSAKILSSLS